MKRNVEVWDVMSLTAGANGINLGTAESSKLLEQSLVRSLCVQFTKDVNNFEHMSASRPS